MNSTDPTKAYSLANFLYEGQKGEFTLASTSLLDVSNGVIYPYYNIVNKYIDIIKKYTINVAFTENEYQEYKYQPKKLSRRLYGTIELWYLILLLNNIDNTAQFNLRKIKVFDPKQIPLLNKILMKEKNNIQKNKKEILNS